jgi:hypothetical protein
VLLQSHIKVARTAGLEEMLLLLLHWEKRVWRERQGQIHAIERALGFAGFVEDRLEYATNMVQPASNWYFRS